MTSIAVVGLGHVGPPLAVEFGKLVRTIGVDIGVDIGADRVAKCRAPSAPSHVLRAWRLSAPAIER